MSDVVIHVENIGKKYRVRHQHLERYVALRDVLSRRTRQLWQGLRYRKAFHPPSFEEFWALKDVSFQVKRGDRVGIIGRNGAGKSTLLKILSRITEPSTGFIHLRGRVASLLEVGTGFHPELTGRENIFLNGAILGMTRMEIRRKFDEIVAFAEVEKFLDTPVKRYSSGMYVRLAFAVAAHLEPEILVVDEVLAVGDLAFQKKCLGKMEEVSGQGRTVLFVSHNMQVIRDLCSRGLLIDQGAILVDSTVEDALTRYNQCLRNQTLDVQTGVNRLTNRRGSGQVRFSEIALLNQVNSENYYFIGGETVRFRFSYQVFSDVKELALAIRLRSGTTGEFITSDFHIISDRSIPAGTQNTVWVEWSSPNIRPGEYPLYFWLGDSLMRPYDVVDDMTHPMVVNMNVNDSSIKTHPSNLVGVFSPDSRLLTTRDM
ncbi:MAG: ABC transporter ATP-binding protein [Cyanobacteria bacterium J06648_16]